MFWKIRSEFVVLAEIPMYRFYQRMNEWKNTKIYFFSLCDQFIEQTKRILLYNKILKFSYRKLAKLVIIKKLWKMHSDDSWRQFPQDIS